MTQKEDKLMSAVSSVCDPSQADTFEKFLVDIRASMSKCKYRKVLEEIRLRQGMFIMLKDFWKLTILKIRSLNKITTRKIFKYETVPTKSKNIESWLGVADKELDDFYDNILRIEPDPEKVESIVQVTLEHFYNWALFSKNQKLIGDCAGFLALSEKIIKVYYDITKDPRTLNIFQKVYLFISSLLIVDNDFETAKNYQSQALKLCYKELFLRMDSSEAINMHNMSKISLYYIQKLFVNIAIAFYQRGACEENCGSYLKANEAYLQAKWFTIKFLKTQYPELAQFINDVNERCQHYTKVFIKSETVNFDYSHHREQDKEKNNRGNEEESRIFDDTQELKNRFSKNIEMIQNIKFPEFENNFNKSNESYKEVLYTVKTVNNLLSSKFKDIVKNLDRTDVHKIDKDSFNTIQKRLNLIKTEENILKNTQKSKEKTKDISAISRKKHKKLLETYSSQKQLSNSQSVKKSFGSYPSLTTNLLSYNSERKFQISEFESGTKSCISREMNTDSNIWKGDKKHYSHDLYVNQNGEKNVNISNFDDNLNAKKTEKQENILTTNANKDFNLLLPEKALDFLTNENENNNKYLNTFKEVPSKSLNKTSRIFKKKIDEIEKFQYDGYISNKSFQNKLEKLNNVSVKELNFQKKILNLKRLEKEVIPGINVSNIENKHKNTLTMRMKNSIKLTDYNEEKNVKKNLNEINSQKLKEAKILKLEGKIIRSLDTKALDQLNQLQKLQNKKPNIKLRDEFKLANQEEVFDLNKIMNENNVMINKIDQDIKLFEKLKLENLKELHPIKFRERPYTARKSITTSPKKYRPIENFVKTIKNAKEHKDIENFDKIKN
jgi:hypothetical protein